MSNNNKQVQAEEKVQSQVLSRSEPSICIPRVFLNITRERVFGVFAELFGENAIDHVDMIQKQSEKGDKYQRVFIHFREWPTTAIAQATRRQLIDGNEVKIVYEGPWYWKCSASHSIRRDERPRQSRAPFIVMDDNVSPMGVRNINDTRAPRSQSPPARRCNNDGYARNTHDDYHHEKKRDYRPHSDDYHHEEKRDYRPHYDDHRPRYDSRDNDTRRDTRGYHSRRGYDSRDNRDNDTRRDTRGGDTRRDHRYGNVLSLFEEDEAKNLVNVANPRYRNKKAMSAADNNEEVVYKVQPSRFEHMNEGAVDGGARANTGKKAVRYVPLTEVSVSSRPVKSRKLLNVDSNLAEEANKKLSERFVTEKSVEEDDYVPTTPTSTPPPSPAIKPTTTTEVDISSIIDEVSALQISSGNEDSETQISEPQPTWAPKKAPQDKSAKASRTGKVSSAKKKLDFNANDEGKN